MARRLTDTYFVKYSFSVRNKKGGQRLSTKTYVDIYEIPEMESIREYIITEIERQVKDTFGDDYKTTDFVITEITPL